MNYKLMALVVLSTSCINGYSANGVYETPCENQYDTFFAPYDGLYPVSLDSRFEGVVARHPKCFDDYKDVFNYNFKGYIKLGNGFFLKEGVSLAFVKANYLSWSERCLYIQAGIDIQLGKYWDGIGAIRAGLFENGPGIGADYWLIYKRFKWLTTLEFSGNRIRGCYTYDDKFKPLVKWLNRFFIVSNLYISFGVNYLGGSKTFERAKTQAFIGFGSSI